MHALAFGIKRLCHYSLLFCGLWVHILKTFREDYPKSEANEENKRVLKGKIDDAKAFAEKVNSARRNINLNKQKIEQVVFFTASLSLSSRSYISRVNTMGACLS